MAVAQQTKPEAIKIVRTEGGYAVFAAGAMTLNPSAVYTTAWEVMDWVAGRLAEWEEK